MKKVYENPDFSMVGHFQSLLESSGIRTEIRNEGGSSVAGEVPFTQVYPELWVRSNNDLEAARTIIADYRRETESGPPAPEWTCPACGESVDGTFSECWNCSTPMPGSA
jgi:hypothetical protein